MRECCERSGEAGGDGGSGGVLPSPACNLQLVKAQQLGLLNKGVSIVYRKSEPADPPSLPCPPSCLSNEALGPNRYC